MGDVAFVVLGCLAIIGFLAAFALILRPSQYRRRR
jgi:hypothetical protein